jgi:hypothetical protein
MKTLWRVSKSTYVIYDEIVDDLLPRPVKAREVKKKTYIDDRGRRRSLDTEFERLYETRTEALDAMASRLKRQETEILEDLKMVRLAQARIEKERRP